jgi:hypothetical protein
VSFPGLLPRSARGQAVLEYLIVILVTLMIILGVMQLALLYNARSMLKLAAFHAARAAIVARSEDPAAPVTPERMKKRAQLAAFVTLLPILPGLSGAPARGATEGVLLLSRAHPDDEPGLFAEGLRRLGARDPARLLRLFRRLRVDFVRPDAADPTHAEEAPLAGEIRFDDAAATRENLIKVRVTWRYPLTIPFVNHLMASGSGGKVPSVPMTATYVMRMQWDRAPGET